ncbi:MULTISPECIES: hypothetical protein [unclassified Burkholderia]|uniref:hypothetical protein n=1 Tax=unclassified Burkholderia TaxID=2613784 RepID=UPI002AB11723|nr:MULTISPECIES: hypothetical protein [unclassified Burkholderia]
MRNHQQGRDIETLSEHEPPSSLLRNPNHNDRTFQSSRAMQVRTRTPPSCPIARQAARIDGTSLAHGMTLRRSAGENTMFCISRLRNASRFTYTRSVHRQMRRDSSDDPSRDPSPTRIECACDRAPPPPRTMLRAHVEPTGAREVPTCQARNPFFRIFRFRPPESPDRASRPMFEPGRSAPLIDRHPAVAFVAPVFTLLSGRRGDRAESLDTRHGKIPS